MIQFTVPTLNSRTSPAPRSPARRVGAQRVLVSLEHPTRVATVPPPATRGGGLGVVPAGILQLEDTAHGLLAMGDHPSGAVDRGAAAVAQRDAPAADDRGAARGQALHHGFVSSLAV